MSDHSEDDPPRGGPIPLSIPLVVVAVCDERHKRVDEKLKQHEDDIKGFRRMILATLTTSLAILLAVIVQLIMASMGH
jgi:hypothetical protein